MIDPPLARRRLLLAADSPARIDAGGNRCWLRRRKAPHHWLAQPRRLPKSPGCWWPDRRTARSTCWADALLPALEQSLPPDTSIQRVEVGSADGVTGANQFEVRGVPDGMTVLLAPGEAALAWMVGDPRAQFDVGHWVPVLAGTASAVVVVRPSTIAKNSRGARCRGQSGQRRPGRVAGTGSARRAAGAGVRVGRHTAARNAFAKGEVDAVFLHGQHVPDQVNALAAVGAQTWFTLGSLDEAGRPVRDPAFTDVPHFTGLLTMRLGRAPNGALYDAWRAVAAAATVWTSAWCCSN